MSPMPSADKQNIPHLHGMRGPCLTGSTLRSDIDRSIKDIESGDHSSEYTVNSSDHNRWLQKEISDSSTLGERNGSTATKGILEKTSTKGGS